MSFIIYLIIQIVFTIFENILVAIYISKKDEYGYPYYVCSVCYNELETKQEAFCDECEEEFNEKEEELTACQVINLQEDRNFKFCQMNIEKNIPFTNKVMTTFCDTEFFVFPKQNNLWENRIIDLNLEKFGRISIGIMKIRYNENQFTKEDIELIKTYRFL